jgi:hypothetical protein
VEKTSAIAASAAEHANPNFLTIMTSFAQIRLL